MKNKLFYLALVFLFVYFILRNLNDGKELLKILSKAKWEYIFLALLLQFGHFVITAVLHSKSLGLFEIKWKLKKVFQLVLASVSLNIFAPFAPFPGSGVFFQRARKEGFPALSVAASILLVVLGDFLALTPLLAVSIYLQYLNNKIFSYEIVGVFVFLILVITLFAILTFGLVSPKILKGMFWILETLINLFHRIFKKRSYFINGWHDTRATQFIVLSRKIIDSGKTKNDIFLTALGRHMVDILTLFILFLAFGTMLPPTTIFVGYSLMILFLIVTPTPQGVGFVEALTPSVFSSMGINSETSTLAVLAYRGFNLWLPVIIGFGSLHTLLHSKN